jgi:hypothetical protein
MQATMQKLSASVADNMPGEVDYSGTSDAYFTDETVIYTYPSYYSTQHLHGEPNATVTITVSEYTTDNTNYYVLLNGVEKNFGDTITVPLAPDGNGSFTVWISPLGRDEHGTIHISLQITATSTGTIGTPDVKEYSKTV